MLISALAPLFGSLRVDSYARCWPDGAPSASASVDSASVSLRDFGCSAEVSGVLHAPPGDYAFSCEAHGGQNVFVWVDDHLVCHSQWLFGEQGASAVDGTVANPIEVRLPPSSLAAAAAAAAPGGTSGTVALPFVAHIYAASSDSSGRVTSSRDAYLAVRWARVPRPLPAAARVPMALLPPAALSAATPDLEARRRQLQRRAAAGWGAWTNNLLSVVRLPHSLAITTALCRISSGACPHSHP
jgi:hypothetical protein